MIPAVIAIVVVVVAAGILWSRFSVSRAERRSLDTYEQTLHTLGDVARRSDAVAEVHVLSESELAQPHVRSAGSQAPPKPAPRAVRIVPPARVRLEPPVPPRVEPPEAAGPQPEPVIAEVESPVLGIEPPARRSPVAGPPLVAFDFDDTAAVDAELGGTGRGRRMRLPSERQTMRRTATGAAAAVALAALAVGGWQLATRKVPATTATTTTLPPTTVPSGPSHHRGSPSSTTTTTTSSPPTPTTLQPTSTSATLVTYVAPQGSYTVTFRATTGDCWLGAQSKVNTSAYLQMWTLAPGQSATYTANGPLVVKIGAPKAISIAVNGRPLRLPRSNINAYDISFVASSSTST